MSAAHIQSVVFAIFFVSAVCVVITAMRQAHVASRRYHNHDYVDALVAQALRESPGTRLPVRREGA